MWRDIVLRLRALFFRRRMDDELGEELQFHIEMQARKNRQQNPDSAEAERQARLQFGSIVSATEECREARRVSAIDILRRDLRYGVRMLRKSPSFTLVAVMTLALGIGANAVVFAVVNGLILRPLNLPSAGTLYGIDRGRWGYQSYPDYIDLRDRNRSFDGLAAFNITAAGLDAGDTASRVWIYEVTGNYFDVLGIQPHLGRVFHAADEHGPNSAPYIVLSHAYWHSYFNGDANVVGRVVQLNRRPFTVVGITPKDFRGTLLFFAPDFFVPMVNHEQIEGTNVLDVRGSRSVFEVIGHLKPGVTPAQAVADLNAIGAYLEKTYPKEDGHVTFSLGRPALYGSFLGGPVTGFLAALMLLAVLILLAACANLGSLFAARAAERSREVALRLALGASRRRILSQLFTEAVLISIAGGALGLLGGTAVLRALSFWQPLPRFSIVLPVSADTNVYVVALLLSLASGFLFGAVPVRQILHTDPYEIVKSGSMSKAGRRFTLRDGLLVVQIAICALLVTSSLVAFRGLARSLTNDFGFEPGNALLVNTNLTMAGYRADAAPAMQKRMIDAVMTITEVASAGFVDVPPLGMGGSNTLIYTDDTAVPDASNAAAPECFYYRISPEYFQAAGTTLLAGRTFTWYDDKEAPRVAVVNREFARRLFGSEADALGRYFKRRDGTRLQVVGIVEDGKYFSLTEEPRLALFIPMLQSPVTQTWLVVRSTRDPQQLAPAVRAAMRNLDSAMPVFLQTWQEGLNGALFPSRVATVALGILGLMGAALSITGIFGLAAYSLSKRMRELGIRIALGANRRELLQAALGRAFKLLAFGSIAGVALGLAGSRLLAVLVYQASPRDPFVLAGVVVAMCLLGLVATWIPAQRALAIDPLRLLREE